MQELLLDGLVYLVVTVELPDCILRVLAFTRAFRCKRVVLSALRPLNHQGFRLIEPDFNASEPARNSSTLSMNCATGTLIPCSSGSSSPEDIFPCGDIPQQELIPKTYNLLLCSE